MFQPCEPREAHGGARRGAHDESFSKAALPVTTLARARAVARAVARAAAVAPAPALAPALAFGLVLCVV
jgi:hypothetical protein